MMRDDRYAVAVADAYSRINNGNKIGVCIFFWRYQRSWSASSLLRHCPSIRRRITRPMHRGCCPIRIYRKHPLRPKCQSRRGRQMVRIHRSPRKSTRVHAQGIHHVTIRPPRSSSTRYPKCLCDLRRDTRSLHISKRMAESPGPC
ncbi:MAG: hypothetical protein Ct9H300mP19_11490 [Dehalococcoidia bacterium]|nr:MAG: hypothetical protein Ct9H300mP19_11490 [Dehalococcoidia bacterium]